MRNPEFGMGNVVGGHQVKSGRPSYTAEPPAPQHRTLDGMVWRTHFVIGSVPDGKPGVEIRQLMPDGTSEAKRQYNTGDRINDIDLATSWIHNNYTNPVITTFDFPDEPPSTLEQRLNSDAPRVIERGEIQAAADLIQAGKVQPREGVDFVQMPSTVVDNHEGQTLIETYDGSFWVQQKLF